MTDLGERIEHRPDPRRRRGGRTQKSSVLFLARDQQRMAKYAKDGRSCREVFPHGAGAPTVRVIALVAGQELAAQDSSYLLGSVVLVLRGIIRFGSRPPLSIACPGDLMLAANISLLRAETDAVVLVMTAAAQIR